MGETLITGAPPRPEHSRPSCYYKPAGRGLVVAAGVAAVIIATANITVGILSRNPGTGVPSAAAPAAAAPQPVAPAATATCESWPSIKAALNAIPQLPSGWDWTTPNIDMYIENRTEAIVRVVDLFTPAISAERVNTVTAMTARRYVDERLTEITKLRSHIYKEADVAAATVDSARLDKRCGVG
ncbi:hypothetical protein H7J86_32490 [Mycobacterium hackensackense]|uniref:hypothetical protein n=1 Tax=Mycobacterium hackensackense TaxID=228909 RepID=UPI0022659BF8|nr:hypothetical protein [Mycobacterium hackensackense]MCV7256904.1 hypothetical protein [Mycobacterium hackensackense]